MCPSGPVPSLATLNDTTREQEEARHPVRDVGARSERVRSLGDRRDNWTYEATLPPRETCRQAEAVGLALLSR